MSLLGYTLLLPLGLQAATSGGFVVEWGWNTAAGVAMPAKQVTSDAVAISAGTFHSLALKSDGTVYGCGGDVLGAVLGSKPSGPLVTNGTVKTGGQILSNVVSVAASREFSLALKRNGTVVTWGRNYVPEGVSNVVAIAAEESVSWILKRDGTVVGWLNDPSSNGYGQLLPVEGLSNVVAFAVGPGGWGTRGVALKRNGTVGHWGNESDHKDATPPVGLSNVVAVAAGASHSLALKSNGTVVGWGWNKFGEATGIPMTNAPNPLFCFSAGQVRIEGQILSNVVSIAAGRGYSLALKKDGTVVAWGRMVNGQYPATAPEGLSNVVAIAAGAEDFCLAITTNRAVAERFHQ